MKYNITISGEACEEIKFDAKDEENVFQSLQFWIDTVEENANDRSSNIRNKVKLEMLINEKTKERCKRLMDWSLLADDADVYRTVRIEVIDNGTVIRAFQLAEMFVDDYIELYAHDAKDSAKFILTLIQKAGKRERFRQDSKKMSAE